MAGKIEESLDNKRGHVKNGILTKHIKIYLLRNFYLQIVFSL